MMKTLIQRFLPAALLLLATTACEDTLIAPEAPATGDGPTLTLVLDSEDEQTRTELDNADAKHHVSKFSILIYKGTGDDATYADIESFDWEDDDNDNKMQYTLKYAFANNQDYTLLGVGMDDAFESTYTIDKNQTLGKTYARLKKNATPAQCEFFTGTLDFDYTGKDMQMGTLTVKRRVAGVMLYVKEIPQRLPAPASSGSSYEWRTTKVLLRLGRAPKKNIVLRRDFSENTTWTEPEGNLTDDYLTEDDQVLLEMDLTGLEYDTQQDIYKDGDNTKTLYQACYMLPLNKLTENYNTFTVEIWGVEDEDGTGSTQYDSDYDGEKDKDKEVKLLKSLIVEDKDTKTSSFDIRSNYIYCIGKKATDVDQPISLSGEAVYVEVQPWEGEINTNNPDFGAARVQALFDKTDNKIHNCMNEEFEIEILPPLEMIRDQVTSIKVDILHDNTYALDKDGKFILVKDDEDLEAENRVDYYKNWIYVRDPDRSKDNPYDTGCTIYTKGGTDDINNLKVTFFIEDYARFRQWGWSNDGKWTGNKADVNHINADYRYIPITLTTHFGDNIFRTDTIHIKQYNTISVYYKNDNVELVEADEKLTENGIVKCGFSRFDLIDDEDNNLGYDDCFKWGFTGKYDAEYGNWKVYTAGTSVEQSRGSRVSGARNVLDVGDGWALDNNWFPLWNESASCAAQYVFKRVDEKSDDYDFMQAYYPGEDPEEFGEAIQIDECWYLPAQMEMGGIMEMSFNSENLEHGLKLGAARTYPYWTSTLNGEINDQRAIYCWKNKDDNNNEFWEWGDEFRTQYLRIRQARKFSDYKDPQNENDITYAEAGW